MVDVAARVFGVEAPTFRAGPAGSNLRQLHDYPAHGNDDTTRVNSSLILGTWLLSPQVTASTQTAIPGAPSTPSNKGWRDDGYLHPLQGSVATRINGTWSFRFEMQHTGVSALTVDFTLIAYAIDASNVGRELFRDTNASLILLPGHQNITQTINPGPIILNPGEILQYEFYFATLVSVVGTVRFHIEAPTSGLLTPQVDLPEIEAFIGETADVGGDVTETGVASFIDTAVGDDGADISESGLPTFTATVELDAGADITEAGLATFSQTVESDQGADLTGAGIASFSQTAGSDAGADLTISATAIHGGEGGIEDGADLSIVGQAAFTDLENLEAGADATEAGMATFSQIVENDNGADLTGSGVAAFSQTVQSDAGADLTGSGTSTFSAIGEDDNGADLTATGIPGFDTAGELDAGADLMTSGIATQGTTGARLDDGADLIAIGEATRGCVPTDLGYQDEYDDIYGATSSCEATPFEAGGDLRCSGTAFRTGAAMLLEAGMDGGAFQFPVPPDAGCDRGNCIIVGTIREATIRGKVRTLTISGVITEPTIKGNVHAPVIFGTLRRPVIVGQVCE